MKTHQMGIGLLCVVGIALSAASLHGHYSTSASEYCDLSATFNCDLVNRSRYSEIIGIPVALIGLAGYLALLSLALLTSRWARRTGFAGAIGGMGFSLYLTYIEARVLETWCPLCLGSMLVIACIAILAALRLKEQPPSRSAAEASSGKSFRM